MTPNPQSVCKHCQREIAKRPPDPHNWYDTTGACWCNATKYLSMHEPSDPASLNAPAGTEPYLLLQILRECDVVLELRKLGRFDSADKVEKILAAAPAPAEHQGVQGEDDEEDYSETSTEAIAKLAANMNAKLAAVVQPVAGEGPAVAGAQPTPLLNLIREYVETVRASNPDEDRCNAAWEALVKVCE